MKRSSLLIGQEQQAEFRDGYACRQTSNWRYAVPFGSIIFTTIHVIRPSSFIEPSHHRPVPVTRHVNSAVDRITALPPPPPPSIRSPLSLSFPRTNNGSFPFRVGGEKRGRTLALAPSAQFNARPVTVGRVCDSSTCGAKEGRPRGGE